MVVSIFKVLLKEGEENSVEVRADDVDINDGVNFWIGDERVGYFPKENIVGFYEVRQEEYTPMEES